MNIDRAKECEHKHSKLAVDYPIGSLVLVKNKYGHNVVRVVMEHAFSESDDDVIRLRLNETVETVPQMKNPWITQAQVNLCIKDNPFKELICPD